jgi:hypothetical protein
VFHIIKDELNACLPADRRVTGREELERHRSERTAAGRKARFQWIWAQRISPKVLHGHPSMAETVTIISIQRSLRGPLVLFNPALRDGQDLRIDAQCPLTR